MQTYLNALAELIKLAAMYNDKAMTGHVARLLELSLQPKAALEYWQQYGNYFSTVADTMLLQDIEDYLRAKAME
jgi:hypothetical protein